MNDDDNDEVISEHSLLHYLIQWGQYEDILICDIAHSSFQLVEDYLITHMATKNPIYGALKMFSVEGTEEMIRKYIRHILHWESSIMAITADAKTIKGVCLLIWCDNEWRTWLALQQTITTFGIFNEMINMHNILHRIAEIKLELDVFDYMSVQQMAVEDYLFRNRNFMVELCNAMCEAARHMNSPRITYIAMSFRAQRILGDFEWEELSRLIYSIHKVENKRPFDVLRTLGELHAVLFHLELPPLDPYYEMTGFEDYHRQLLERAKFE